MAKLALKGGKPLRERGWTPWPQYDERELRAVQEVVESRNWGGFPSPNVKAAQFARRFASAHTAKYGICTSSGTTALEVALKAAGVKPGDEVLVPALTFMATAAAALFIGATPVFVDIHPGTYCIDASKIPEAITARTKAVVPVHLGSRMADMDSVMEIARRHNLKVIEDCAHMHGGFWRGKGAGSLGHLGCFSFQTTKLMTAGEGGIIITDDEELEERCQSYINCGRIRATDKHIAQGTALGWNYRLTEFQAAILLVQLDRLWEQMERREKNARYLSQRLEEIEGIATLDLDERITRPSGYCYIFKYHREHFQGVSRDAFVRSLQAEGIPCYGAFYEPVYRSPLFAWRDAPVQVDYSRVACPVAERAAYQEGVWLPHQLLLGSEADMDDIAEAIIKIRENLAELVETRA